MEVMGFRVSAAIRQALRLQLKGTEHIAPAQKLNETNLTFAHCPVSRFSPFHFSLSLSLFKISL